MRAHHDKLAASIARDEPGPPRTRRLARVEKCYRIALDAYVSRLAFSSVDQELADRGQDRRRRPARGAVLSSVARRHQEDL